MSTKFPLEKILTASATEYCISAGKRLEDYDLIGIHVGYAALDSEKKVFVDGTVSSIPKDTERVCNALLGPTPTMWEEEKYLGNLLGTALIPKKQEKPNVPNQY